MAASSASAAPVAFDPSDITITASSTANGQLWFDPQTGYAGLSQTEGTTGTLANFSIFLQSSGAKPQFYPPSNGTQVGQVAHNASNYAPRFSLGTGISAASATFNNTGATMHDTSTTTTYPWNPGDRGYLGLAFPANAATGGGAAVGTLLYGWAEVSYNANQSLTLYRFGYDNAGGSSVAGAVPEPGSLAATAALGAAGLLAYRRRRAAAAQA